MLTSGAVVEQNICTVLLRKFQLQLYLLSASTLITTQNSALLFFADEV